MVKKKKSKLSILDYIEGILGLLLWISFILLGVSFIFFIISGFISFDLVQTARSYMAYSIFGIALIGAIWIVLWLIRYPFSSK
tara:strand:+ start:1503 stop:1751 length:249 start_codon:yes stop_codon:yes gene_type:complete